MVIDADLYPLKDPLIEDTEAAMDIVGDEGCVILIFSAPSFASSNRAIAAEQGMHGKTMQWESRIGVEWRGNHIKSD